MSISRLPKFFSTFSLALLFMFGPMYASAQSEFQPSFTEYGHPNFQGTWNSGSLTLLQRPDFFSELVVSEEQAELWTSPFWENVGDFVDPDNFVQNISHLDRVRGELRSSAIVSPGDGKIPYTERGLEIVAWDRDRFLNQFDGPKIRPLDERCLGTLGYPPYRPFVANVPRKVVQTEQHIVIYTEDSSVVRIIPFERDPDVPQFKSYVGTSTATWEGNSLVIETSNFRGDDPGRLAIPTSLFVGENSQIRERLTMFAEDQLLYEFEISDEDLYSETWRAEFTFYRDDAKVYEYACHEGNYSMPGTLIGGRRQQGELDF